MAKKTYGHSVTTDDKGNVLSVRVTEEKGLTAAQKQSTQIIGWSEGPGKSRGKRLLRDLFG